jgi:hypothetical protein
MSVSSLGASSDAYSYLQSLLPQQSADRAGGARDPMGLLMDAFYPTGGSGQANATGSLAGPASPSGPAPASLSPDTMANLIAVQEQQNGGPRNDVSSRAQSVFAEFDADGDGQISKSEFENVFGSTADTSKVDGLFNALDANGDGAISQSELTSAAQASHAHHRHHAHGSGQSGGLLAMLMSASQGATAETSSNADGSSTTTISYSDGSKVTMTLPASSGSAGSSSGGTNGQNGNPLEQLIALQAQWLAQAGSAA